jgi:hypothetical protein
VDVANNKLRSIAGIVREHGVGYEKSHFTKKLENNVSLNPKQCLGFLVQSMFSDVG